MEIARLRTAKLEKERKQRTEESQKKLEEEKTADRALP
jgi:hypothetical protein